MSVFLFSRVWVSRGACERLLPGTARLRHLPDNTHGLLGGVHRSLRHGGLLRQPANETPEIHLWMQRWNLLQRGSGKDHQVRLRGLHVAPFTHISCRCRRAEDRKKGRKEGRKEERGLEESEGGKERKRESIKNIYKTSIYILWTTMFVK